MKRDWLWDRKITNYRVKKILGNPEDKQFLSLAALLLARKNSPKEVFGDYLDPVNFCCYWSKIKRVMRKDTWNNPRIIFWQAIYEKLMEKYKKKGVLIKESREVFEKVDKFCKTVGEKLKAIRKQRGLTQKDLANKLKISQQMISHIEQGKENISLLTLKNIAKSLGLEVYLEIR